MPIDDHGLLRGKEALPMCRFKRLHHSGTEALISEHPDRGWRVQINLQEANHTSMTIAGVFAAD